MAQGDRFTKKSIGSDEIFKQETTEGVWFVYLVCKKFYSERYSGKIQNNNLLIVPTNHSIGMYNGNKINTTITLIRVR